MESNFNFYDRVMGRLNRGNFTIDFWMRRIDKIRNWPPTAKLNLARYIW